MPAEGKAGLELVEAQEREKPKQTTTHPTQE